MKYTDFVNVFQGNAQIDLPEPEGLAAKWFFIKALSGNTNPAACLPFGGMSVSPYSGGYPTGYGENMVNTHAIPRKFEEGKKLLGFAHLQQSGTGAIEFYYNYALTVPRYDDSAERRLPLNESARPGYYSCMLDDILCEITADNRVAFHRYSFGKIGGKITVDFCHNGLDFADGNTKSAKSAELSLKNNNTVLAKVILETIPFYFAVKANGSVSVKGNTAEISGFEKCAELKVTFSNHSFENALTFIESSEDFDTTRRNADEIWENALSKIKISTKSNEIKEIFYSNLYHSLIKPVNRNDDGFLWKKGPFMTDFATLWDMYKTAMPLVCMVYKDVAEDSVETLLRLCETFGCIPNCIGLSDKYKEHSTQARTLGCYVLMTAYRYGIKLDAHRMVKAIEKDVFDPDKRDFTEFGKCKSNTWVLDMADCCALASQIAEEIGEAEIAEHLRPLASHWENCFDKSTGLLTEDSDYYEGTLYNYSFRQLVSMDERIKLAGGNDAFIKLADKFFGYGQPDRAMPTDPTDPVYIPETMKNGIFEGFNNESDTEAPFSYIYAGRHDRTCEIIRTGMKYMFTTGRGGIPGNNDSGALSSYYVFLALGLFPVAGHPYFLIGSPFIDEAEVRLSSGSKLNIKVNSNSEENIYVEKVIFNGKAVSDYRIPACELMNGGQLEFTMSPNPVKR